jgi:hypothetical protein
VKIIWQTLSGCKQQLTLNAVSRRTNHRLSHRTCLLTAQADVRF